MTVNRDDCGNDENDGGGIDGDDDAGNYYVELWDDDVDGYDGAGNHVAVGHLTSPLVSNWLNSSSAKTAATNSDWYKKVLCLNSILIIFYLAETAATNSDWWGYGWWFSLMLPKIGKENGGIVRYSGGAGVWLIGLGDSG